MVSIKKLSNLHLTVPHRIFQPLVYLYFGIYIQIKTPNHTVVKIN